MFFSSRNNNNNNNNNNKTITTTTMTTAATTNANATDGDHPQFFVSFLVLLQLLLIVWLKDLILAIYRVSRQGSAFVSCALLCCVDLLAALCPPACLNSAWFICFLFRRSPVLLFAVVAVVVVHRFCSRQRRVSRTTAAVARRSNKWSSRTALSVPARYLRPPLPLLPRCRQRQHQQPAPATSTSTSQHPAPSTSSSCRTSDSAAAAAAAAASGVDDWE
jgi:hypothetical protein